MEIEKYLKLKKNRVLEKYFSTSSFEAIGIHNHRCQCRRGRRGERGTSNRRSLRPRTRNREGERSLQEITTTITTT